MHFGDSVHHPSIVLDVQRGDFHGMAELLMCFRELQNRFRSAASRGIDGVNRMQDAHNRHLASTRRWAVHEKKSEEWPLCKVARARPFRSQRRAYGCDTR